MKRSYKKPFRPHLFDADVQIERDIFRDRIHKQDMIKNHFGLTAIPQEIPEESMFIRGFASVLHQCEDDIIIHHPRTQSKLIINQLVGARNGYLMSCGDYQQQMLDMIHQYVNKGDKILEIGAGLGVTTCVLGAKAKHKVVAVEPQKRLHSIIEKNCQLNTVDVDIICGLITPEKQNKEVDFHIMQDYLRSSIFESSGEVDVSVKIPHIDITELCKNHDLNTLVFDIVGAEIGLIYEESIQKFDKIICALNTPLIGEEKTAHILNHLGEAGFSLKNIRGLVFVFVKKQGT